MDPICFSTHVWHVSIFKEFATDYSNASFELCRVALVFVVVSPITNADMVIFTRKKTV